MQFTEQNHESFSEGGCTVSGHSIPARVEGNEYVDRRQSDGVIVMEDVRLINEPSRFCWEVDCA